MSKIRISLRPAQRLRIEKLMQKTTNKYEALRCRIILLLDEQTPVHRVAKIAGCVRATVYRTIYRFEDEDEDGLIDGRKQREPLKVTPEVIQHLMDYLDKTPKDCGWRRCDWTLELLAEQLRLDTGVVLSRSHVWRVLRQEGCRRGSPRPALHIPVAGRAKILADIADLVASASPDEEVLYADEVDIHLNPRIGLSYMKRGQQKLVLTPGQNEKYYIAGALNARTGKVLYCHGPKKNSDLFIAMVEHIRKVYRRPRVIHLILDNYIIHKSGKTRAAIQALGERVRLHFLPPYSPEHNPIERLWKQLHDNVTRNHRHPNMQSLWKDVVQFLKDAQPFPGTSVALAREAA